MHKRTNIELDVELIEKALKVTNLKTIKEVVHYSLRETIRMNNRRNLIKFKGKLDWDGNLDEMRTV